MAREQATLEDLLEHAEWMRGLARRLLGDRDEAEDVVQEAWLSALRVPPERGRTLRPWIATVVLNLVRSRARSSARARARIEAMGPPEPTPVAEDLLAEWQTQRLLAELVLGLDEPYRRTILLRFHDGLTAAEIARAQQLPEGTVRWRLKYGLDELRRRFLAKEDRGRAALGALLPLAGKPAAPAAVLPAAASASTPWVAPVSFGVGKVALTMGAVATLTVVATEVRLPRPRAKVPRPAVTETLASRTIEAPTPAAAPVPTLEPFAPIAEANAPSPDDVPVALPPVALTPITGLVRDGQGLPAARVPVTLRRLHGNGAADLSTMTDETGRFRYDVQSHASFVLTAELPGEPAARVTFDVPTKLALSLDAQPVLGPQNANDATIDVSLGAVSKPPRAARRSRTHVRPEASELPPTRWCCHEAFAAGDVVYGRTCMRFGDGHESVTSGCDLYRLKMKVSCQHRIRGGVSTADLSRTEELDCDGRLL